MQEKANCFISKCKKVSKKINKLSAWEKCIIKRDRYIDIIYNLHKCWKILCSGLKVFVFVEVYELVWRLNDKIGKLQTIFNQMINKMRINDSGMWIKEQEVRKNILI